MRPSPLGQPPKPTLEQLIRDTTGHPRTRRGTWLEKGFTPAVNIGPPMAQRIQALMARENISVTSVVRMALHLFLEEYDDAEDDTTDVG